MSHAKLLALDVGERRIGVAAADTSTKIAYPVMTIPVDGQEIEVLRQLIAEHAADLLVVGYPRNQSGDPTAQTAAVEAFVARLVPLGVEVVYQDESLTSVMAEQYLASHKKSYTKEDIDAHAASIILTDYLEANIA